MKNDFIWSEYGKTAPILIEETAYPGVREVAKKVAKDALLVCGSLPDVISDINDGAHHIVVFAATCQKSLMLDDLVQRGRLNISKVEGKREVYGIEILTNPWEGIEQALVIYGSDKRGTIYGLFHLSELIGVSPLVYWGDAVPEKREQLLITKEMEMISREPSVEYRGFFINDEWPCFGNWTFEHFGGFTCEMYDFVFELLLRLNGNYLWPAMWTSSFALDGPGLKNAELADLYGVVIGNSHHEPCLRASEEWDLLRGEDSIYGNEWNYYKNREGLLKYWADGLARSGAYEGIITIGMRGERDSSMLGPNATLKQNIDLLKDIITQQNHMIKEIVEKDEKKAVKLLALYKEVEEYFYGNELTEGLIGWEELNDTILMLCEDNLGNMRTLPTKQMRSHPGGYGMYYHFDYHGDPISYEWVNSTPLSKVWEQMTMAYEYGVRKMWVVNVGDLKFNEFGLSYFMKLAYDYKTWGIDAPNQTGRFTKEWLIQQFGSRITQEQNTKMCDVLSGYVRINGRRRPEALNSGIYHPVHYNEGSRVLNEAESLIKKAGELMDTLPESCLAGYYSMIYFPAVASCNLLKMHLYAGLNEHYAKQGKPLANEYARRVTECIVKDRELANEFAGAFGGKWNGMQLAQHIGFTKWNEDNCRYPLRITVEPAYKPRMVVSRADQDTIAVKDYFAPMVIEVKDFLYLPNTRVDIEIANAGLDSLELRIEMQECEWLKYTCTNTTVKEQEVLTLICDRSKLTKEICSNTLILTDGDTTVHVLVMAKAVDTAKLEPMTFLEDNGIIVMEACHYAKWNDTEAGTLKLLDDFGKFGSGFKSLPVTEAFVAGRGPSVVYRVFVEVGGTYELMIHSAPSNPMEKGRGMCVSVQLNGGKRQIVDTIPDGFLAGVPHNPGWTKGVLDQIRITSVNLTLEQGENVLEIGWVDPGFVLERLILRREDAVLMTSYMGPKESYFTQK